MNKYLSFGVPIVFLLVLLASISESPAQSQEKVELWPGLAPSETIREPNIEDPNVPNSPATVVTTPYLIIQRPTNQESEVCVIIVPGGGFNVCFYKNESIPAKYWNERGYMTATLVYRVPRPTTGAIYTPALQDMQRAIRYLRGNAEKYGINPNKIGAEGYSAGACLTLLAAVNSETQTYEPIDDLDKLPCNIAFAIPVYTPYFLDDGATDPNINKGEGASALPDFHFDSHTPPMCLIHGDNDIYSPLASVEIYKKLRQMKIPCELHIFAEAPHGFMFWDNLPNAQSWQNRRFAWFKKMGF